MEECIIYIYIYVTINTKIVLNVQTNFEQTLVYKWLLCGHLKQEFIKIHYVIRIPNYIDFLLKMAV